MQQRLATILALSLVAGCSGGGGGGSSNTAAPLLQSASDGADWLVPGKTYGGNRLTTLTQIDPSNVATLKKAWVTAVKDDGEEEASPIVWNGTVFVTTSHDNVLAMDGKSGTLKWAYGYSPAYELQYPVNRGVGLSDGKLYIVTQDCRLVAIDAATGAQVFNVPACHDTSAHVVFHGGVRLQRQGYRRNVGRRSWRQRTRERVQRAGRFASLGLAYGRAAGRTRSQHLAGRLVGPRRCGRLGGSFDRSRHGYGLRRSGKSRAESHDVRS